MATAPTPPAPPAPAPANWIDVIVPGVLGFVLGVALCVGGWFFFVKPTPVPTPPGPAISLPESVQAKAGRPALITATTTGKHVNFRSVSGPDTPDLLKNDAHSIYFISPTAGSYQLQAITVVNSEAEVAETHVLVDVGPGPGPGPTPPVPPPVPPTPPPIPGDGLRVLMVYDASQLSKYPAAQRDVLYSDSIRSWLSAHVAKGADGKSTEWRIYDKSEDVTNESATWQAAMKRDRKSLPWIVISTGKAGFEGPLPATIDETMKLLQQYAK